MSSYEIVSSIVPNGLAVVSNDWWCSVRRIPLPVFTKIVAAPPVILCDRIDNRAICFCSAEKEVVPLDLGRSKFFRFRF